MKNISCIISSRQLLGEEQSGLFYEVIENRQVNRLISNETIRELAHSVTGEYLLVYLGKSGLQLGFLALERFIQVMDDTHAGFIYSDYNLLVDGNIRKIPLATYQPGSVRDDFSFGKVIFIKTAVLREMLSGFNSSFQYAGLYDFRLKITEKYPVIHLNETLYSIEEENSSHSDEKQFAYVDPKNREVQVEMEEAFTGYLKNTGAWIKPFSRPLEFADDNSFDFEASVIIPVRNRVHTIEDAIRSVLEQETTFEYNLIIVDNHSTDGTSDIIRKYTEDRRVIHLLPPCQGLNIGGCWNYAIHHPRCGKFCVQLDSDDLYFSAKTLEKIVNAFYQEKCAMVIGSYKMVNFNLETIPPGVINHREWTPENGRNNALRINGLGAPGLFTHLLYANTDFPIPAMGKIMRYASAFPGNTVSDEFTIYFISAADGKEIRTHLSALKN